MNIKPLLRKVSYLIMVLLLFKFAILCGAFRNYYNLSSFFVNQFDAVELHLHYLVNLLNGEDFSTRFIELHFN